MKHATTPRNTKLVMALFAMLLLVCTAGGAFAAAPLAGSQIGNQATATYQDGVGGPVKNATSNTVYTYVQQVASLALTIDNQTKTVSVGGTVYFLHTVTNNGNGNDTFSLSAVKASGALAVVESVKAASDIYAPLTGKVVAVNESLADKPESINEEPYASWLVRLAPDDVSELERLLDAAQYEATATPRT